MKTHSVGAE